MENNHIAERLAGIQQILRGVHAAGQPLSASSKGREREAFIQRYLADVFPTPFRFGTGDITDRDSRTTGQLDVVVEYPFLPSLPGVVANSPRLYLSEGVAAVIEVKSNLAAQWDEVLLSAPKVAALRRELQRVMSVGEVPSRIPFFAAGYVGWKEIATLKQHLDPALVQGILVIDPGLYVSTPEFLAIESEGPWALWGLISCLHHATTALKISSSHPIQYAL